MSSETITTPSNTNTNNDDPSLKTSSETDAHVSAAAVNDDTNTTADDHAASESTTNSATAAAAAVFEPFKVPAKPTTEEQRQEYARFRKQVALEESIDVTGDGGITKRIIRKGTGATPLNGSVVKVHFVCYLKNGTIIESTREKGQPFSLELGKTELARAWEVAVQTMRVGEHAWITIKPDYAWGSEGLPAMKIPPNAELEFEVELLGIATPKGNDISYMTLEDRLKKASELKEQGNKLFKEGNYARAIEECYDQAADYLKTYTKDPDDLSNNNNNNNNNSSNGDADDGVLKKQRVEELQIAILNNFSICCLKLKKFTEAINLCTEALGIDPKNVKALYRRGQAYVETNELEKALKDFEHAYSLSSSSSSSSPNNNNNNNSNREIVAALQATKQKMAAFKKREAKMFSGLFDKMYNKDNNNNNNSNNKKEDKAQDNNNNSNNKEQEQQALEEQKKEKEEEKQ